MSEKNLSIFKSVAVSAVVNWQLKYDERYAGDTEKQYDAARQYVASHTPSEIVEGRDGIWGIGQDSLTSIATGIRILGEKMGMPELTQWSDADIKRMITEEDLQLEQALERAGSHYKGNISKDIVDTLEQIHDAWVENPSNSDKYFKRDKKYQYLPLEFMGWAEAQSDMVFLEPVIQASGCKLDMGSVKKEFETREAQLVHDLIKDGVVHAFETYQPIQGRPDIIKHVLENEEVQNRITEQAQEKAGARGTAANAAAQQKEVARANADTVLTLLKTHVLRETAFAALDILKKGGAETLSLKEKADVGILALSGIMDKRNETPGFTNQEEFERFKEVLQDLGIDNNMLEQNPELQEKQQETYLKARLLMVVSNCESYQEVNNKFSEIEEKELDRDNREEQGHSQAD